MSKQLPHTKTPITLLYIGFGASLIAALFKIQGWPMLSEVGLIATLAIGVATSWFTYLFFIHKNEIVQKHAFYKYRFGFLLLTISFVFSLIQMALQTINDSISDTCYYIAIGTKVIGLILLAMKWKSK